MVTSLLVFAVLALLTVGIMLVSAAAALPRKRPYDLHMEAEKKGDALLRSWPTPEQDELQARLS
jgi:hypothetical protein